MRRIGRWALLAAASVLVVLLVLPYLLPFSTTGTLSAREAAAASVGASPTYLSLEGLEVHVERVPAARDAETAGPVPLIVVLHGFGASAATWRDSLPGLAELGDVVAYDRPPFGFTERPQPGAGFDPYGTAAQVALLSALIDRERGEDPDRPVVLVGHSAGGALAAEAALRRPEQVDALVLVAPAILTTGGTPGWLQPVLGFPPIDRWGPWLARLAARGSERLLEVSWHDPSRITDEVRRRYAEPQQVQGWEEGLWQLVRARPDLQVVSAPERLQLPVLLVTGDDDRVVPTEDTRRLATLLGDADLAELEATGHVPHEESPDAFLRAVTSRWPLAPGG